MKRRLFLFLCVLLAGCAVLLVSARIVIARAAKGKTYSSVLQIPHRRVGLVLGCPKQVFGGWANPFFENRIAAAAELYFSGKIDYLILSGDNHVQGYDEPTDMKNALLEKGVPADRLYLDYAGFRTLDSVVRAKEIFGQERFTIISQRFHNQRAIFIARHRGIDAIAFDAPEVALRYSFKTQCREQFAKVKAVLDIYLFRKQPHFLGQRIVIGNVRTTALDPDQAAKLAELMCRQLPNVGTIDDAIQIAAPSDGRVPVADGVDNTADVTVLDDTYDALVRLGPYSLSCLVDRLTDTRWMPDPRSEPLVGDVAYMILGTKGVDDVLPGLAYKKPAELTMGDYLSWPRVRDHRLQLQHAVRAWLREHPKCCATSPVISSTAPEKLVFRMPPAEETKFRTELSRLYPGMSPERVLKTLGKPDATDSDDEKSSSPAPARSQSIGLLGFCASDHNENLAYIYFIERWTGEIGRRDPLRDRYVILYFSAKGKFLRMFSNVAEIPPILPPAMDEWYRLAWGERLRKE